MTMADDRFKYTMLLSSLPVHPSNLFTTQQTPVSEIQLERRLTLLDADDARDLALIIGLLHWSKIKNWNEASIVKQSKAELEAIQNPFLKKIVCWRLELRTVLAALRRRHAGEISAPSSEFLGFGSWPGIIVKHWHEKDFGVGHRLPWLVEAAQLLEQNKTYALEQLLLNEVWRYYARVGSNHYFDFAAVVIYVLRWDVVNRWLSYNSEAAVQRFDDLVSAALPEAVAASGI